MNFFIPSAKNVDQSERVYRRIVTNLNQSGYPVKPERIYKISYRQGASLRGETVGEASLNGEIVLAIFEHETGYFICTYSTGAVWGKPFQAAYEQVESVEVFN